MKSHLLACLLLLALLCGALLVSACGGSSRGPDSPTAPTAPTANITEGKYAGVMTGASGTLTIELSISSTAPAKSCCPTQNYVHVWEGTTLIEDVTTACVQERLVLVQATPSSYPCFSNAPNAGSFSLSGCFVSPTRVVGTFSTSPNYYPNLPVCRGPYTWTATPTERLQIDGGR